MSGEYLDGVHRQGIVIDTVDFNNGHVMTIDREGKVGVAGN